MQIMYLEVKLIVYWTWRGTEFLCFALKFQYSQCDVMLMFCFFKLYYINIITLIIRVIRLRLSNAIYGSNFSEKMCMRLKRKIDFQHVVGIKRFFMLSWNVLSGSYKDNFMDISNRSYVRLDRIKVFICTNFILYTLTSWQGRLF